MGAVRLALLPSCRTAAPRSKLADEPAVRVGLGVRLRVRLRDTLRVRLRVTLRVRRQVGARVGVRVRASGKRADAPAVVNGAPDASSASRAAAAAHASERT